MDFVCGLCMDFVCGLCMWTLYVDYVCGLLKEAPLTPMIHYFDNASQTKKESPKGGEEGET